MDKITNPICFVDPKRPGIVRFYGGDELDGLLAATRAPMIVRALNRDALFDEMAAGLRDIADAHGGISVFALQTVARALLAKIGEK